MSRTMKAFVMILCIAALVAACAPQPAPPPAATATSPAAVPTLAPTAASQKPIRIGVSAPVTGGMASIGQGYEWGATLAVEDLGGQIAGRKLEIVMADDKATPADAVTVVRRLIDDDKVDVILGPAASGAFLAAMPIAKESKIPILSVTASTPDVYNQIGVGGNEWAWRLNLDDLIIAKTFASFIAQDSKSVFIIGHNNDFGRSGAKVYQEELPKFGTKVVGSEFFEGGSADFRPILTKIKQSNADAIMTFMVEADSVPFMRQLKEVGLKIKIFSRGGIVSPLFLESTKDDPKLGEGTMDASYWTIGLDPQAEKRFQERWNSPPTVHRMLAYYGVKLVIADAISRAISKNGNLTREGIREALKTTDLKGTPLGDIKFDSHNQAYPFETLTTLKDGKIMMLKAIPGQPR